MVEQASLNGGTGATCGTSEPLKNKGNKEILAHLAQCSTSAHLIENPCGGIMHLKVKYRKKS